jgi:hypothetical protein
MGLRCPERYRADHPLTAAPITVGQGRQSCWSLFQNNSETSDFQGSQMDERV